MIKNYLFAFVQQKKHQLLSLPATRIWASVCQIGAGVLLLFFSAQATIPFGLVPLTLQTVGLVVLGCSFPKGVPTLATSLYVALGTLGFPLFAGFRSGIGCLLGPTGGYLIGMVVCAWAMDAFRSNVDMRNGYAPLLCGLMGVALIYVFGVGMLAYGLGLSQALKVGFFPFFPIEMFKLLFAYLLVYPINKKINKNTADKQ
ncbi:MAG TPA: biotin transporter BioY [Amoebophilaceae bacterium]|jgi:biotin transport system substrate-specific component|nr:biotin transporter BioY [Amoebophilaceae bacterium]